MTPFNGEDVKLVKTPATTKTHKRTSTNEMIAPKVRIPRLTRISRTVIIDTSINFAKKIRTYTQTEFD
jgi:hypothetical protein